MNGQEQPNPQIVYTVSSEKLAEFRNMPFEQRLKWLEETNAFINRTLAGC